MFDPSNAACTVQHVSVVSHLHMHMCTGFPSSQPTEQLIFQVSALWTREKELISCWKPNPLLHSLTTTSTDCIRRWPGLPSAWATTVQHMQHCYVTCRKVLANYSMNVQTTWSSSFATPSSNIGHTVYVADGVDTTLLMVLVLSTTKYNEYKLRLFLWDLN